MADICVFEVLDFIESIFSKDGLDAWLKPYPNLVPLYEKMLKIGRIAQYREERSKRELRWADYAKSVDYTLKGKL